VTSGNEMTDLVRHLEGGVNEARKRGDVRTLLELATAAMDRLDAAAGAASQTFDENQVMALKAALRIGYNAAADVWPGWEVGTPARSDAQLQAAQTLAQRSSSIVERLSLGSVKRGNAIWLIGALDLARGRVKEAFEAFGAAAGFYFDAPAVKLLSEGYMAIAAELMNTSSIRGTSEFASVIARLDQLGSEDATEFRNQLQVARQIFNRA
jgi:hypothetical protein